jgi:molybdopterin-guanine dinucleotide biosynthesis protein A
VIVDAIVLAGGRSSRLGSVAKAELLVEGRSLLARTLDAAAVARRIVVVGPEPSTALPEGVLQLQEKPAFAGPVAAIATGLMALKAADVITSDAVLALACDMPHVALAVPVLVEHLIQDADTEGVLAVDGKGRLQPLAAVYRTQALHRAIAELATRSPIEGARVFSVIEHLSLTSLEVPAEATSDIDTWDDAARLGVERGRMRGDPGRLARDG